jgi:phospholipid/cholesterol/gamma-HCH transport system substrate-binding protein
MATRPPRFAGLAAVIGFALSCFGLLIYLWSAFGGPIPLAAQGYRVTAIYPDASQLIAQTDVRIYGVDVGRVTDVTQEGELTRAELEIDPDHAPIPTDTSTVLRRKTLLGEPFIELVPGTPEDEGGEMLPEGAELAAGQTQPAVELDEALRALDPPTRRDMKLVLRELARGVGEQGPSLNAALGNLRPATAAGADFVQLLASQEKAVRSLVRDSGTTLEALSERRGALHTLVSAGEKVLRTTAERDEELTETVRLLPPALEELRPTLELARDVGVKADPLLRELDPASRELTPTLTELRVLAPDLRGLMGDLGPLLDAAPTGIPAFSSTLEAARPFVRQLRPALQDAVPALNWLAPYRQELAAWLTKLGTATQSSAGPQDRHILRVVIPFTQEGLGIYDQPLPINRHNAYSKPGYLDDVGTPFLRSFDCQNASGPELGLAPPCVEQGPFDLGDFSGTYPQVHRAP